MLFRSLKKFAVTVGKEKLYYNGADQTPTVTVTATFSGLTNALKGTLLWYLDGALVEESDELELREGDTVTCDVEVDVERAQDDEAVVEAVLEFDGVKVGVIDSGVELHCRIGPVSLDDEHIGKLLDASPFYSRNVIAADTYAGVGECTTVAVGAVVIARDDVSDDAVYDFISATFNDLDGLAKGHAKANELSLEFAASVTAVPYHDGAAKYLAEQGYTVPTK